MLLQYILHYPQHITLLCFEFETILQFLYKALHLFFYTTTNTGVLSLVASILHMRSDSYTVQSAATGPPITTASFFFISLRNKLMHRPPCPHPSSRRNLRVKLIHHLSFFSTAFFFLPSQPSPASPTFSASVFTTKPSSQTCSPHPTSSPR